MNTIAAEQVKTLSTTYFWKNLARKSWVSHMSQADRDRLQCLERELRFELYKEFDEDVVETAIRLSEQFRKEHLNCKRDLSEFFPEAAVLVYSEWKTA